MTSLHLSIGCGDYDRTRAVADGRVRVEGCEVTYIPLEPEEVFYRSFGNQEFDVCELSFSNYLVQRSQNRCAYIAVPVFPSICFRHSAIYIRTDRGINRPEDLKGRVVGVPEYAIAAAVLVRGILKEEYGVKPSDIEWRSGGLEEAGRVDKLKLNLPADVKYTPVAADKTLSNMLAICEIDALVTARAPSCFKNGAPHVDRLFPKFREVEKAYFKKTGIIPIMHVLGIRERLVQEHNWSNQMFSEADIGRPKVEALRDVMDSFCSFTPRAVNYPYKDQPLSEVVIAAVDSMSARKAIWKSVRQQTQVRFYIDARMGLETLRVFALNPAIREHRIAYSQSLYSDSGALQEPCTARTISYTPLMAAAVICNQVKRYVNDEEIVGQVVMDLVTYAALKL